MSYVLSLSPSHISPPATCPSACRVACCYMLSVIAEWPGFRRLPASPRPRPLHSSASAFGCPAAGHQPGAYLLPHDHGLFRFCLWLSRGRSVRRLPASPLLLPSSVTPVVGEAPYLLPCGFFRYSCGRLLSGFCLLLLHGFFRCRYFAPVVGSYCFSSFKLKTGGVPSCW
jgi:hypothetical protein